MEALFAFFQVILIDLALAGDNAIIIGALVSKLPENQQNSAKWFGLGFAFIARLFFTLTASWLMMIPGLNIIGGFLLLWIAYGMIKDQLDNHKEDGSTQKPKDKYWAAIKMLAIADITMSLDNVLGVAGAAHDYFIVMTFGLLLSMFLMGGAATIIAKQMAKRPWLVYIGIAAIILAGVNLIYSSFAHWSTPHF